MYKEGCIELFIVYEELCTFSHIIMESLGIVGNDDNDSSDERDVPVELNGFMCDNDGIMSLCELRDAMFVRLRLFEETCSEEEENMCKIRIDTI